MRAGKDLILDHTTSWERIYSDRARSGWRLPSATLDRSGPQMVNGITINYSRLLIDTRYPHIDPMFFLHHAVRPKDSFVEMVADVPVV